MSLHSNPFQDSFWDQATPNIRMDRFMFQQVGSASFRAYLELAFLLDAPVHTDFIKQLVSAVKDPNFIHQEIGSAFMESYYKKFHQIYMQDYDVLKYLTKLGYFKEEAEHYYITNYGRRALLSMYGDTEDLLVEDRFKRMIAEKLLQEKVEDIKPCRRERWDRSRAKAVLIYIRDFFRNLFEDDGW